MLAMAEVDGEGVCGSTKVEVLAMAEVDGEVV